jgi:hypothetical protein
MRTGGVNVLIMTRRYVRKDRIGRARYSLESLDTDGRQDIHSLVLKIGGSGVH